MKRFVPTLLAAALLLSACRTQPPESTTSTTNPPTTSTDAPGYSKTDSEKAVLKPPESKTGVSTTPTLFDQEPRPPLGAEAQRHEYLGFRLGMTANEAVQAAQGGGKKLEELEKNTKYQMDGCLVEVPNAEKAKNILLLKDGKLNLLLLFWDDHSSRMYNNLMPMLMKRYGQPEKADELFRRFWILENGDCIRLLYDVAAHQTSLVYGSKQAVIELNDSEKKEIPREYPKFP